MSNVPGTFNFVNQASIQYNNPVSESSLDSIAGAVNGILSVLLPVGSIIDSMLTEMQFNAQLGGPSPSTWVIADGRDVTDSGYNQVTGLTNIPDLRGIFRRAKNNGGTGNPDGDLTLGTVTAGRNQSHTHAVSDPGHAHQYSQGGFGGDNRVNASPGTYGNNGDGTIGAPSVNTSFTSISLVNQGGNDTAPTNVTVNTFIRIN